MYVRKTGSDLKDTAVYFSPKTKKAAPWITVIKILFICNGSSMICYLSKKGFLPVLSFSVDMKNTLFFKLKAVLPFGIIRLWLRPDHNKVRMEAPEIFRVLGKRRPEIVRPFVEELRRISETDSNRVVRIHCLGAIKAMGLK